jgi:uncharacterized protein DUF3667
MKDKNDNSKVRTQSNCLNCGSPLAENNKYCSVCGQKNIDGRITFRQFISDFFEAAFNLDSKIIKTIPAMLVPAKLTRIYFSGKHNSYIKPLRLFFTTMILFYAVLGFKYLNKLENLVEEDNPMELYDHAQFIDTVIAHIGYDSLTKDQQDIVDTIVAGVHAPFDAMVHEEEIFDDTSQIPRWIRDSILVEDSLDISTRDLFVLSADSIFKKYNKEGFIERLTIRQTIAVTRYPGKLLRFIIGNTTWMILIMLPVVAGMMQLMYLRRKKYFIEHLIFLYHYHAAVFLVMTIFLLIFPLLSSTVAWAIPASLGVFFFMAMKVYYRQNWLKTLIKFLLLGIAYILLLSIFGGLTSVISFFIYQ